MSGLPVVAIVGRPNVGKSTLFNRILGERRAIVEDEARTTRDRIYGEAEWAGRRFVVVDTGGLEAAPEGEIELRVQAQARIAIAEADLILFVVDAETGPTPADLEAAELLRSARAPVLVVANKVDNRRREMDAGEFYALGWSSVWPVSALHGRGSGELLDAIVAALPSPGPDELARREEERAVEAAVAAVTSDGAAGAVLPPAVEDTEEGRVAVAIVGRPNVGKSSLLNALLGQERAIVSPLPGTTRDAIDTPLTWGRSQILLIDTAGIRRRGRVARGPAAERYSTLRALRAITRADVAILVLDAREGLTAQDAHIAGYVVEEGRGLVLALNKWDLVPRSPRAFDEAVAAIRQAAPFLDYVPIVSISALTGQRVDRVLEVAVDVWGERRRRVGTGELNRVVQAAVDRQAPPAAGPRRPKILYATQVAVAPPTFVFFCSGAEAVHFSYRRYLENRLREAFGFGGSPLRLVFRERERTRRPPSRTGAAGAIR